MKLEAMTVSRIETHITTTGDTALAAPHEASVAGNRAGTSSRGTGLDASITRSRNRQHPPIAHLHAQLHEERDLRLVRP
jgi:hypothetical protein